MTGKPANKQDVLKNGRPNLAVLAGAMTSEYHEGIIRGAAHVAAEKDFNLIIYCGGVLDSEDPITLVRDKVFDLVDMDLIDGIISPFSSHLRFIDNEEGKTFIDKFSSVPIVNIGSYIEGHTNVITDYETGFTELFKHFYHEHGYRNIALVRGPKFHDSSEKRMGIYKRLLEEYQLPFDEDLVIYSNLNKDAAKAAVGKFLDNITKPFDAIITISDEQALGIIDVCQSRGIKVPEDVAVIGSMNTLEGTFSTPSLTTIEEPLFELGRSAAIELIAQIEGKAIQPILNITTSLIIRQSCGCKAASHHASYKISNRIGEQEWEQGNAPIFSDLNNVSSKIVGRYKGGIITEEVTGLLFSYQHAIKTKDFSFFLIELQNKLELALKHEDIMLWLALVSELQVSTLRYLENEPSEKYLISFIEQAISIQNNIEQVAVKFQRFETEYYLNYFRSIVNNLNSSFDLAMIKNYTVDILQLSELYISLYHDINAEEVTATNMVSVRNNEFIELDHKEFIAKKLIPLDIAHYHERFTLLVLPLSYISRSIGFLTLNLSNRRGVAFENLRSIISSALKNEILVQDLKKAEERFTDIAHSTSNWLWETDENNEFTYCSNSCEDIIGYSANVLVGKTINDLSIKDSDSYIKSMRSYEDLSEFECWCEHKDGRVVCLLISAKPIKVEGVYQGYRGVFEDITEQKLQKDKIKKLAYSDILTGLANRASFQDKLADTISFSALKNKKFAVMFINLDHFKYINDSMGHSAGDLLLIRTAEVLAHSIGYDDLLARLGGDEFIIILPDIVDESDIIEVAQCIFKNIKEPILLNEKAVYSTLSLGVSVYPTDGVNAESLLQKGGNAMYQAKSQGRNGYVFYDKVLEERNTLRNMNEEILREALATDGFILHYQPQVLVETGDVIGFEVLVRIENSTHGIVPPNNFVPLAEELGLIGKIDECVFEKSCAQYADWRSLGLKHTRLSINLSALQLRNDSVLATYIQILERYDIDPQDIQIEITENAIIENEITALTILEGFKRYGLSIALDDFGTGYSSLNCINLYPIDTIKIDRSFVIDAVDNPKNKAIIQGIVLMATSLNLKIIAEGVETQEQHDFIKQLGCHEIQGFYFHRPYPVAEAQALLKSK